MGDKITAPKIVSMKAKGEKIVCLTAYDFTGVAIADSADVDLILVGDSLGNVILGYETTVPVELEDVVRATQAASRAKPRALLVADMPFGSYQSSPERAVDSAISLVKSGAEAVKLEGAYLEAVAAIVKAGIPVMGHVGMTPQSYHAFGGFKVQGKGSHAEQVIQQAKELEKAGVFSIVLELIPAELSYKITAALGVPTIGIGAGPGCDGQIQVFHDILGLSTLHLKHAKRYAEGRRSFTRAIRRYSKDVRDKSFPAGEHSF